MQPLPLRLLPQQDLRAALEALLTEHGVSAAFVVAGIGSLSVAKLRYAGQPHGSLLHGDLEILTLSGTLSPDGAHLHMSVADARGVVCGGHVEHGCIVRTTAEILVALLPDYRFSRAPDPESGFKEICIQRTC